MKRLFVFFTLFFLCFYTSIAQESLKKHTVSSGETILSIAKKYNVTPYDLQQANPNIIQNIQENDVLIIPESKINTPSIKSVSDSIKASVVYSSISYTVKYGDTKYSLAKRFELSIKELESQNPHIVSGLQSGHVLEIHNASTVSTAAPKAPITSAKTSVPELKPNIPESNRPELKSNIIESYLVKSGDTKFGLSKRFNTTIPELERANPHIIKMLIVGQTLKIPSESDSTETKEQEVQSQNISESQTNSEQDGIKEKVETVVINKKQPEKILKQKKVKEPVVSIKKQPKEIIIQKKETVVEEEQLNKTKIEKIVVVNEKQPKENIVEQEEIIATNTTPEVTTETTAPTSTTATSDTEYVFYKIQPKETVYGLSKKAGMTISEFLTLNPQLKQSVQIGTFIKMPKDNTIEKEVSISPQKSIEIKRTPLETDLRISANPLQSKSVLFFLPFSQVEYQNIAENGYKFNSVSDDFTRHHMEFYKGANIAIDSIRKMGLNLNIDVVEAENTKQTSKIKSISQENSFKGYDAIILPFYDTMEEDIAALTADSNIPVITASTIAYQSNSNNLYSALPSINEQKRKILDYMMAKQAHIIVLSDSYRTESKNFVTDYVPSADIINIKINGTFSESELISKFKKDQLNFVVIDSERNSVFLNTTNILLSQLSNYSLQLAVLESSLVPDDNDVSQKRYRILKMIFPSLIPEKSTASSKKFLSNYLRDYNIFPSRYTMFGFDITFDSLLRLIQEQSFEDTAVYDITEYTQLKFKYEKNTLGSYSNEGIYILQYDSDANIREAN